MTSKIKLAPEDWIDKRFTFGYPVGAFPALVERLRGTPARIEWMLTQFPADLLTRRDGDAWSVQEHIGHLISLEELHDGRLDDYDAGLETLRAADMTNRKTYEADYNSRPIRDVLRELWQVREKFVARLEAMDEQEVERSAMHPRLQQPMRVIDLAQFVAEHDDHHLAGIRHLAQTLGQQG
jgi:hypothetical protein